MTAQSADGRRVVVLLRTLSYLRLFDPVIRGLLERGDHVHLLHERADYAPREAAWLEELERHPRFSVSVTDALYRDGWGALGYRLRAAYDYVHVLGPGYTGTGPLIARTEGRVNPLVARFIRLRPMRIERVRRVLARLFWLLEEAIPSGRQVERELAGPRPDVLVMAPHLMPAGRHSEYVRIARALGIPTCMCIASWDNLSTKQQIREIPDRIVVWNRFQRDEAVNLHGLPEERIVITGAQSFDQWFDGTPSAREDFCSRVGLDPARPYLLFLGGALFPGERTEATVVHDTWIPGVRGDPGLADVQVLVRPHPRRQEQWTAVPFDDLGGVAVWPSPHESSMPMDQETRGDFFDSIHHSAAVVGVNTTAMLEAAAVGRTVHTLLLPEWEQCQTEIFHFSYLVEVGGGLVRTAPSLEEHRAQLLETLEGRDVDAAARRERFLTEFVRPYGLDEPALPRVLQAIEETAAVRPVRERTNRLALTPLRLALQGAMALARAARGVKRRLPA
ncbi:MAG: hypothetical protein M3R12_00265 [Actinomycetota bacterium]|nr:hypothetical protein [Actinomycetota bacterium]